MTRHSRRELRTRTGNGIVGKAMRGLRSAIRRVRIETTGKSAWGISGPKDADGNTETDNVENFANIGFASRPRTSDNAEAIMLKVGAESGHPVIVATRNQSVTQKLIDGEGLAEGETIIHNHSSMVKIGADGSISIGSIGGARQPLPTMQDFEALRTWCTSHIHVTTATPGTSGTPGVISPSALPLAPSSYTQKLEAE